MNSKGAESLGKAFADNKSIQVLNISSNAIYEEGMKGLFTNIGVVNLRVLGTSTNVDISRTIVNDAGILCMCEFLKKFTTLISLCTFISSNQHQ